MLNLRSICFSNGSPQEHVDFPSLPSLPDTPKFDSQLPPGLKIGETPQSDPHNVSHNAKPGGESNGSRFVALAIGNLGSCLKSPRRVDACNETEEVECRTEGAKLAANANWSMDGDTLMADDPFEVGMMLESMQMAVEAEVRAVSGGDLEGANNMEEAQV